MRNKKLKMLIKSMMIAAGVSAGALAAPDILAQESSADEKEELSYQQQLAICEQTYQQIQREIANLDAKGVKITEEDSYEQRLNTLAKRIYTIKYQLALEDEESLQKEAEWLEAQVMTLLETLKYERMTAQ
ncbi:hypothetical protein [Bacillus xiapuensis]|uniref:hypothetical protein n=1 Tax=Bacillus xiapuensis TaxID=2014075 RepID=UPI000C233DF6|nr:hypothetical protein [Bacillus xiapuensis]